jgi:hypothetical protein
MYLIIIIIITIIIIFIIVIIVIAIIIIIGSVVRRHKINEQILLFSKTHANLPASNVYYCATQLKKL